MIAKFLTRTSCQPYGDAVAGCSFLLKRNDIQRRTKALDMSNLNPNIIKLEYAVRGPLVIRAGVIEQELKKGASKPFNKVIRANIGDAQAMNQQPMTFMRQVIACIAYPPIIDSSDFPPDVKARAKAILAVSGGKSIGAYTASYGIDLYREQVANHIKERDSFPCEAYNVCLVAGASSGIKHILELFVNADSKKKSGIMVPIPQYPFYSATIAEFGLVKVDYFLDEDHAWGLDVNELERSYKEASTRCNVRAIVVINPGNPTGQVLTRKSIEDVIEFAHKYNLLIFADEVYQANVYAKESKFYSIRKVLMESKHAKTLEVASFMSASKGYQGECGLRGGWMELVNIDKKVQENLYKAISAMLCPSSPGQTIVSMVASPPKSGDPSFDLFMKEKAQVLKALAERAVLVEESFNKMPGFHCNQVQGAMYAFPRIELPPKAIEAAKKEKKQPDVFYAFRLLEETGICIIAGSGFGQRPNTYHFRTTLLPQTPLLKEMLSVFGKFHSKFTKEFS